MPNGCPLLVAPDSVYLQMTDAAGIAEQPLNVPLQPALLGVIAYAQWFQWSGAPFDVSDAVALQLNG